MTEKQLTEMFDIRRDTNWARDVITLSDSYEVEMPNWDGPKGYVNEKYQQALRDTERLRRDLQAFVTTGQIYHLENYRMTLDVMREEVDRGAWWAIAEGAR